MGINSKSYSNEIPFHNSFVPSAFSASHEMSEQVPCSQLVAFSFRQINSSTVYHDGRVDRNRVLSQAGLFGSGSGQKLTKISGLIRAREVFFVLGAQKYNQNNLATLLNFSDLT